MPLPKQKDYTIEDIYALPDGERAELIDGQIYYMAPPTRTHQRIVTELTVVIHEYIKKNHGKCEVNVSPFAVFLDSLKDKTQNYLPTAFSVICYHAKIDA
uniref:Uma2 family endonuclease n=1 Tax=Enterocloster lavalensis TaxID=460384 RepID=UPI002FDAD940